MGKFKSELRSHRHSSCLQSWASPFPFPAGSLNEEMGSGLNWALGTPGWSASISCLETPDPHLGRWCGASHSSAALRGRAAELEGTKEPVQPSSLAEDSLNIQDRWIPKPLERDWLCSTPVLGQSSCYRLQSTLPLAVSISVPTSYLCREQPGQVDLR